MPSKKKDDYGFPKCGKKPQRRNKKLNPRSPLYDPDLAARRKKEKNRRKANRLNRGR